jgi:hypothetical protein
MPEGYVKAASARHVAARCAVCGLTGLAELY